MKIPTQARSSSLSALRAVGEDVAARAWCCWCANPAEHKMNHQGEASSVDTPSDLQRLIFMQFDKEFSGRLSAQDCLCLVDALFRALLISPAALSARVAEAPEGPIVTGRGPRRSTGQEEARQLAESIAQARLQSRLHEAERAAERAVATVGPAGPVGGFLPEPIAAPFSDASVAESSDIWPPATGIMH
ncbi:unnamed protein product [Cladocopium goreaui]|uniref:Uncharacterized protein n=1 Tax=Cladocopium goreaui TaxID=2562237 RepID=A0A9P1DWR2_9DINO|nr:unnamed protein product [Cladocopium goreaui]